MTEINLPINIGIIGPGRVADRHARALQQIDNVQLWSVAGRVPDDTERFANSYGAQAEKNAFTDISEMLFDPQLDAVIIASPDKLHTDHILLALAADKSVLVEKPLCTTLTDGQKIREALHGSAKMFAIGYHLRWHNGLRQIASTCHTKNWGQPKHLRLHWAVNFLNDGKWRTNSEYSEWFCLTVLGTHLIDVMRWLMVPLCGEVVHLTSIVNNSCLKTSFDETVLTSFEFESGATAEIFCSLTFDSPFRLELYADNAVIIGDELTGDARRISINHHPLSFEKNNPYVAQLEDFLLAIRQNRPTEVGIEEGLMNIKLMRTIRGA